MWIKYTCEMRARFRFALTLKMAVAICNFRSVSVIHVVSIDTLLRSLDGA